ncbi:hypothetical protein A3Q56_04955 [Intoshia linei]|uniref:Uncharacterized protein n=1 Tax=Intoshia linei TaxID=1819745 RepID=A0A177AZB6_9BILA|nr:hypothetical protein A3Q56_04955 [Intoshia linei]
MGLRSTTFARTGVPPTYVVLGYDMYNNKKFDRIKLMDQIEFQKNLHNKRIKKNFDAHIQSPSYFTKHFTPINHRNNKQQSLYKLRDREKCKKPQRFLTEN